MKKQRWQQIITITDLVLAETSEDTRLQIIQNQCGEDSELQQEVIAFLKSIDESDTLWNELFESNKVLSEYMARDVNLKNWLAGLHIDQQDEIPVTLKKIGPYDIKKHIGSGGMGEVFLAGRTDGEFHQNVALKLIRTGIGHGEQARLFLRERRILSSLNHPNIARLLDGGVAEDGRPYYVMEYVDGLPITEYCRQHQCTLKERLTLFIQVCRAVQYAHANFIVHRDIKPDNLLVNRQGVVKVLDFGIAKLLDADHLGDHTLLQTGKVYRPLSLSYCAPEQLTLEPITAATDVYALGLLLYELLAGKRAYDLKGKTLREAEAIIRQKMPEKPSTLSTEWQQRLEGDLDAICMKALNKYPAERYITVEEMHNDLIRYQSGQPLLARRATRIYRIRKFIERHKTGTILFAFFMVLITLFISVLVHQQQLTQRERDLAMQSALQAELEAAKAGEVSEFLTSLFRAADPVEAMGDETTAMDLLEKGVEELQTKDETLVTAELAHVLGNVYFSLGRYQQAKQLLEKALAIRLEQKDISIEIAKSLSDLGLVLSELDKLENALEAYQQALEIVAESGTTDTEETAVLYHNMSSALNKMSRFDESEQAVRDAIRVRQNIHGNHSIEVASSMHALGVLLYNRSRYADALHVFEEALTIRTELLGEEHPHTLFTLGGVAGTKNALGYFEAAEESYKRILDIRRRVLGEQHPDVGTTLYQIGITHWQRNQVQEAEEWWMKAYELRRQSLGPNHSSVANTLNALAAAARNQNNLEKSIELLTEAERIYRTVHGDEHRQVALIIHNVAKTHADLENYADSERMYREALEMRIRLMGEEHDEVSSTLREMADLFMLMERWEDAEMYAKRALAIEENLYEEGHPTLVVTRDLLERISKSDYGYTNR
ncbi:MAG: serine/threonine protein kinase [Balneolaceae bacterium]|nr:MAG: serine/threonine protein kinase [Balneolaceae bacterium]